MPLPHRLHRLGHGLEQAVDALRARLRERSGGPGPLEVLVYRSHAGRGGAVIRGRVLEERGRARAAAGDTVLHNLLATYRRFETDEVPGATVEIDVGDRVHEVVTDDEGYFHLRLPARPCDPPPGGWHGFRVRVRPGAGVSSTRAENTGLLRVTSPADAFGVISDVDDTILHTGATSLLSVARLTLLHNARTRRAFLGVAPLYRALETGAASGRLNPIFYVSSSPWNLYDLLTDFMDVQGIPAGPLFLQDLGLDDDKVGGAAHAAHKLAMIEEILDLHTDLPFVLLGDSGQKDPEIYREVVARHPGRVLAIYIRSVSTPHRDERVRTLARELGPAGVDMVLAADSVSVARHAAALGLVHPATPNVVRAAWAGPDAAASGR